MMVKEIKTKRLLLIHSYTFPLVFVSESTVLPTFKNMGNLRKKEKEREREREKKKMNS